VAGAASPTLLIKDFYWANRAEFDHRSLIDNGKRSPGRGWVGREENRRPETRAGTLPAVQSRKTGPQRDESRSTTCTHPGRAEDP